MSQKPNQPIRTVFGISKDGKIKYKRIDENGKLAKSNSHPVIISSTSFPAGLTPIV